MAASRPRIGGLRWPVTIVERQQTAAPGGGITETPINGVFTRADIQKIGDGSFFLSVQTETPITTRIFVRWMDWIDTTHAIIRQSFRRDGSLRTDTYRIRKISEFEGRKQYLDILAELERSV